MGRAKANRAFKRRNDVEVCWMCQKNPANTQEHSLKGSRFRDVQQEDPDGPFLMLGEDFEFQEITSAKSGLLQFGKILCAECNNLKSQPWDYAYSHFISFMQDNPDFLRDRTDWDWDEIFGDTPYNARDLARYYVKNTGCRFVDRYQSVPEEMRRFLWEDVEPTEFTIALFRDYATFDHHDRFGLQKFFDPYADVYPQPSDPPKASEMMGALVQDGCVAVFVGWFKSSLEPQPWDLRDFPYAFDDCGHAYEIEDLPMRWLQNGRWRLRWLESAIFQYGRIQEVQTQLSEQNPRGRKKWKLLRDLRAEQRLLSQFIARFNELSEMPFHEVCANLQAEYERHTDRD